MQKESEKPDYPFQVILIIPTELLIGKPFSKILGIISKFMIYQLDMILTKN